MVTFSPRVPVIVLSAHTTNTGKQPRNRANLHPNNGDDDECDDDVTALVEKRKEMKIKKNVSKKIF